MNEKSTTYIILGLILLGILIFGRAQGRGHQGRHSGSFQYPEYCPPTYQPSPTLLEYLNEDE